MEQTVQAVVSAMGGNIYAAIFAAMLLTGLGLPLPGELTLGFTGYLLFAGEVQWLSAVIAAMAGDLLGALLSYGIGFFGRTKLVARYLRFLMPSPKKLKAVTVWLEQYGLMAVVGGRLLPVMRGAIPIPAGFVAMNIKKYSVGIVISSMLWCSALIYLGFCLGHSWRQVAEFGSQFTLVSVTILGLVLIIWALCRYQLK